MSTQPTSLAPTPVQGTDIELADTLSALNAAELDAIDARRHRVLATPLGPTTAEAARELHLPRVGLALSGGGVRSATFALGLMRGLAHPQEDLPSAHNAPPKTLASQGLLGRLDYLSSVSGGGYTAAMYGRLVASYGLKCAQGLMAASNSPVLAWLRRNGRYLTPAGSRDIGIAVVTFLRAWIAIHAEFMVACIALGLVVIGPHLWQHTYQVLEPANWQKWHTPWWVLAAAFWAATAPGLLTGYWSARDEPDNEARSVLLNAGDIIFLLVFGGVAFYLVNLMVQDKSINPLDKSLNWPAASALAFLSTVVGQLASRFAMGLLKGSHGLKVALLRNQLTRTLRWAMLIALGLVGLGALDRLSWWLMELLVAPDDKPWLWGGVGVGGAALVALRALMQPLQKIAADTTNQARQWWPQILSFASLLGMLMLTTGWLVLLQWFVFAPKPFETLAGVPAWLRACMPAALWAVWVMLTAGNPQMANASSLHSFYRARLNRAYLAVGNKGRHFNPTPSSSANARIAQHANVTQVVDGDDLRLRKYRPDEHGGPIHLVNTCLNQTRDDDSGLYNADRKGVAVTATWRGFEVGPDEFIAFKPTHDAGTLGRWVAVSGAAASPGAGAYTSRGLALLVYFLGVRLGLWMRAPRERTQLRLLRHLSWRFMPKPLMLTCEASATFFGQDRPWWYLSDGGHFENSAVYPLIKRELDFIILSDASGDPDYEFGDLENLVRKARIDFGTDIDFYSRTEADSLFTLASNELTVVSPEHLANNHSCRGVLLARIRYRERTGPLDANGVPGKSFRPEGTLLVVKPNLHDALDVDLLAYAQKHTSFPHESTADQSFDEAQWESYHRLGEDFGRALHDSWLAQLPGWRSPARHPLKVAARLGAAKDSAEAHKSEPLWRRSARAAAIGTTLGVGATGTLLLSAWQFMEQQQREGAAQQVALHARFVEATKGLGKELEAVNSSCPAMSRDVTAQTTQMLSLRDTPALTMAEQNTIIDLSTRVTDICLADADTTSGCKATRASIQDLCKAAFKAEDDAMSYWQPCASRGAQTAPTASAQAGGPPKSKEDTSGVTLTRAQRLGCLQARESSKVNVPGFGVVTLQGKLEAQPTSQSPDQAMKPPVMASTSTASPQSQPPSPDQSKSLQPCVRDGARTTLYIHIYDEASRGHTRSLRKELQAAPDAPVMVAPVENVSRAADLRQARKPVPLPKPTLLMHDRGDPNAQACALAISNYIGAPWAIPGTENQVWLRDLPSSLQAQPGVIELWLPPVDSVISDTSASSGRRPH
jgi:hypothetical protein